MLEEWKRMESRNNSLCLTDLDFSDLETFLEEEAEEKVSREKDEKEPAAENSSGHGGSALSLPPPPPPGPPPPPPPPPGFSSSLRVLVRGPPPPPPPPGLAGAQPITSFSNSLCIATGLMAEGSGNNIRKMRSVRVRDTMA